MKPESGATGTSRNIAQGLHTGESLKFWQRVPVAPAGLVPVDANVARRYALPLNFPHP